MRKRNILKMMLLLISFISESAIAQESQINFETKSIGINTDGSQPDSSAILDVKSTSSGVLLPRMSLIQRDAIIQPATGLLVFVTDSSSFFFNAGTSSAPSWKRLGQSPSSLSEAFWSQYNSNQSVIYPNSEDHKVLIGDSATIPDGYKLYVNGGILTNRITVAFPNSNLWADYVFDSNYNLMPLNKVEQFIRSKKHLPGIPSARQVSEEGVDLVKMNTLLLQKIEELTLYQIEAQKRIIALEKKLSSAYKPKATKRAE